MVYYTYKELEETIEKYIQYYIEERIKEKVRWIIPVEYRRNLLAA